MAVHIAAHPGTDKLCFDTKILGYAAMLPIGSLPWLEMTISSDSLTLASGNTQRTYSTYRSVLLTPRNVRRT